MQDFLKASFKITNCYDSHVHWLATGEYAYRLDLSGMQSANDIKKHKAEQQHFRGDWLIGFGWDQHLWTDKTLPYRQILDDHFGAYPVALSRADGHALWLNTEALKRAGIFYKKPETIPGGKIDIDDNDMPTGIVYENAAESVKHIFPELIEDQMILRLKSGADIFNRSGFTHIRDLSGNEKQWSASHSLESRGELNLCVNQFFAVEAGKNFHQVLKEALAAQKKESPKLKVGGIKIYLDGSLGSETAYLSQKYASNSGRGLCLLERFMLKEILLETWSAGLPIGVHAIGDEAFHLISGVAHELWERGEVGILNIEHGQMARPESIKLLDPRQTQVHMQPCHFLSDKKWLKEKLGPLYRHCFPWKLFEDNEINVFYGSDSPIEKPSVFDNYKAVMQAAEAGIVKMNSHFTNYHSFPKKQFGVEGITEFENGQVKKVRLNDKDIYLPH